MPYTLPDLPYAHNALEPVIDEQTMQIHHGKHHNAYVTNLNAAVEGLDVPDCPFALVSDLSKVPADKRSAVRNNGGGHANHTMFWQLMGPGGGGDPTGAVAGAIKSSFGSFVSLKEQFAKAAMGRFGSGWAWVIDSGGKLVVESSANQDSPLMEGKKAIIGLDVWEHAYYIDY